MINQDPERSCCGPPWKRPERENRRAFVDADDIADVAVATLLDPAYIGRIYS